MSLGFHPFRVLANSRARRALVALLLLLGSYAVSIQLVPITPRLTIKLDDLISYYHSIAPDCESMVGLFSGSDEILFWDLRSGERSVRVGKPSGGGVPGKEWDWPKFSPDGRLLAAVRSSRIGEPAEIFLWDVKTGAETRGPRLRIPNWAGDRDILISPDGRYLLIQSESWFARQGIIQFWDLLSHTYVGLIFGDSLTLQIGPDSKRFVTWTYHYTTRDPVIHGLSQGRIAVSDVYLWSMPPGGPPRLERVIPIKADCVGFSPDLTLMVSASTPEGTRAATELTLWDTATGQKRCSFELETRGTRCHELTILQDGKLLLARGPRCAELWALESPPRIVQAVREHASFSPDGNWFLAGEIGGPTLRRSGFRAVHATLVNVGDDIRMNALAGDPFSPDSRFVIVLNHRRGSPPPPWAKWLPAFLQKALERRDLELVRVWNTETGEEEARLDDCRSAYFLPSGRKIATLDPEGNLKIWPWPLRRPPARVLGLTLGLWVALLILIWLPYRRLGAKAKRITSFWATRTTGGPEA